MIPQEAISQIQNVGQSIDQETQFFSKDQRHKKQGQSFVLELKRELRDITLIQLVSLDLNKPTTEQQPGNYQATLKGD